MTEGDLIRIIRHVPEGIPDTGSFEVRFADGRESKYFYWDDNAGRLSVTGKMTQNQAKAAAQEFARREAGK